MSQIINTSLLSHIKIISNQAKLVRHRSFIVVDTDNESFDSVVSELFKDAVNETSRENCLFYGESQLSSSEEHLKAITKNYFHHLGTENNLVVYLEKDFHPDAFCALTGTLVAGGSMVWIRVNNGFDEDPWLKRLKYFCFHDKYQVTHIEKNLGQYLVCVNDSNAIPTEEVILPSFERHADDALDFCKTKEQYDAVVAIERHFSGKGQKYGVLTADRGRGKSSALAIYCAKLMINKNINIVISAPHVRSLAIFFKMLKICHPDGQQNNNRFSINNSSVEFRPIDTIIKDNNTIDMLVIDEAAGFPVYLLSQITQLSRKAIFSSTVHGYEGAGRGFSLKFIKTLSQLKTPLLELHLNEPIRWSSNDPLELFTFDCFLLNAEVSHLTANSKGNKISSDNVTIEYYSAYELAAEEHLLRQIYALLVTAHYQTSPSDLKLCLSNDAVKLIVAFNNGELIGVVLAIAETGASIAEIDAIKESTRQLKNQFLPQSILRHMGLDEAFDFRYLRVARIAIHPELQSQSIGSLLIKHTADYAKDESFDFVGTSYGATPQLAKFWYNNHFQTIRLGVNADKASGEHSVLMLHSLNEKSSNFLTQLHNIFISSFSFMLSEQYKLISPELIAVIYYFSNNTSVNTLSDYEKDSIQGFIEKQRQFHSCVYQLAKGLVYALHIQQRQNTDINILIKRLLQKHSEEEVIQSNNLTGKKELTKVIIEAFTKLFN